MSLENKDYIVIVQCHIVKERCSGFLCEKAFHERIGGFASCSKDKPYRSIYMTCGGCNGRAAQRKLSNLVRLAKKKDSIEKSQIAVQLSTCMTKENYHGPACPFIDQIKNMIARLGLDVYEDTHISVKAEERRQQGVYTIRNV